MGLFLYFPCLYFTPPHPPPPRPAALRKARNYDAALEVLKVSTELFEASFPPAMGTTEAQEVVRKEKVASMRATQARIQAKMDVAKKLGDVYEPPPPLEGDALADFEHKGTQDAAAKHWWYVGPRVLVEVRSVAKKDGDAFKKAAQTALISEKDAARARTLLESATECYAWAELTPEAMGLPRVYESIGFLEVRNDADGRVEAAFDKFKQAPPDYLEAQAKMAAATKLYASAGEAKLAKDIAVVETMIGCAATLDEIDQVVSKGQGGGGGGGAGEVEGDAGEEAEAPAATLTFWGPLPKSGYSPKAAVEAAKPAYQALAALKTSGLRKWSSTAVQCLEPLDKVLALFGHLDVLVALDSAKGDKETALAAVEELVAQCEAAERPGNPWALPLSLGSLRQIADRAEKAAGI